VLGRPFRYRLLLALLRRRRRVKPTCVCSSCLRCMRMNVGALRRRCSRRVSRPNRCWTTAAARRRRIGRISRISRSGRSCQTQVDVSKIGKPHPFVKRIKKPSLVLSHSRTQHAAGALLWSLTSLPTDPGYAIVPLDTTHPRHASLASRSRSQCRH
jgi:hypothetical protein